MNVRLMDKNWGGGVENESLLDAPNRVAYFTRHFY